MHSDVHISHKPSNVLENLHRSPWRLQLTPSPLRLQPLFLHPPHRFASVSRFFFRIPYSSRAALVRSVMTIQSPLLVLLILLLHMQSQATCLKKKRQFLTNNSATRLRVKKMFAPLEPPCTRVFLMECTPSRTFTHENRSGVSCAEFSSHENLHGAVDADPGALVAYVCELRGVVDVHNCRRDGCGGGGALLCVAWVCARMCVFV